MAEETPPPTWTGAEIRATVGQYRMQIAEAEKVIQNCHAQIKRWQQICPHTNVKHHHRQIAEDDSWDECLDCGAGRV